MLIFLVTSVSAASLNPSKYLIKGQVADFNGYLVEKERLEKAVQAVHEVEYLKKLNSLQEAYYQEKLKNAELQSKLELQSITSQSKAVEKALSDELKKKSVFYKQPWFVAAGTALIFILSRGLIVP
jgi:ABC-type uncharacterized transport system ATPase subunit